MGQVLLVQGLCPVGANSRIQMESPPHPVLHFGTFAPFYRLWLNGEE